MTRGPTYTLNISGTHRDLQETRELIHSLLVRHGLDDMNADLVEVAVGEACDNALRYGSDEENESSVELELYIEKEVVKAVVSHKGDAFDFDSIEPFKIEQDFRSYRNGGLGVPLIKALMDEVTYERKPDNTNMFTLIKYVGSRVKKRGGVNP